ncbi:unnamed protein product, partial [Amoebophrya sp. A25]
VKESGGLCSPPKATLHALQTLAAFVTSGKLQQLLADYRREFVRQSQNTPKTKQSLRTVKNIAATKKAIASATSHLRPPGSLASAEDEDDLLAPFPRLRRVFTRALVRNEEAALLLRDCTTVACFDDGADLLRALLNSEPLFCDTNFFICAANHDLALRGDVRKFLERESVAAAEAGTHISAGIRNVGRTVRSADEASMEWSLGRLFLTPSVGGEVAKSKKANKKMKTGRGGAGVIGGKSITEMVVEAASSVPSLPVSLFEGCRTDTEQSTEDEKSRGRPRSGSGTRTRVSVINARKSRRTLSKSPGATKTREGARAAERASNTSNTADGTRRSSVGTTQRLSTSTPISGGSRSPEKDTLAGIEEVSPASVEISPQRSSKAVDVAEAATLPLYYSDPDEGVPGVGHERRNTNIARTSSSSRESKTAASTTTSKDRRKSSPDGRRSPTERALLDSPTSHLRRGGGDHSGAAPRSSLGDREATKNTAATSTSRTENDGEVTALGGASFERFGTTALIPDEADLHYLTRDEALAARLILARLRHRGHRKIPADRVRRAVFRCTRGAWMQQLGTRLLNLLHSRICTLMKGAARRKKEALEAAREEALLAKIEAERRENELLSPSAADAGGAADPSSERYEEPPQPKWLGEELEFERIGVEEKTPEEKKTTAKLVQARQLLSDVVAVLNSAVAMLKDASAR